MKTTFLVVAAVVLLAPVIGCDSDDDGGAGCKGPSDCSAGQTCVDGRCVLPDDGGVDAGGGGARDGGVSDTGAEEDSAVEDGGQDGGQGGDDAGLLDGGVDAGGEEDTGAPDTGPRCDRSEDCLEDEFCNPETHRCELNCRPCDQETGCQEGFECDWRRGDHGCCVFHCSSDQDCEAGTYCDQDTGECLEGCRAGGCDPGQYCDMDTRTCVEGCRADANCPHGQICDGGSCRGGCRDDSGCPEGQVCDPALTTCTWGCVEDRHCGEGQRCSRAEHLCRLTCRFASDCPQGLVCDEGACVTREDRCDREGAEPCPEGEVCNRILGVCQAAGGAACSGPDDCQADQTCLPEPALPGEDPDLTCHPVVGAAGPAAPCEADDDCASGLCLNDGTCFAPCLDRSDCPEGQRCWPVNFYMGPGFDPRDASDDTYQDVPTCRIPPQPCHTTADCQGQGVVCRAWWDPDEREVTMVCLPGEQGGAREGAACREDADCVTGTCTPDGICLQGCQGNEACGQARICDDVEVSLGEHVGAVRACALDPGTGAACTTHAGCEVEGEFCHPEATEAGTLDLRCRPGGEAAPGEPCQSHLDCQSRFCLPRGFCFGACEDESTCTGDQICQVQPLWIRGIEGGGEAATCLTPELPCVSDSDCPMEGTLCIPAPARDDPTRVEFLCRERVGPDATGWSCNMDAECQTGICMHGDGGQGTCYGSCASDEDCPEGLECVDQAYMFPLGEGATVPIPGCGLGQGSMDPCARDSDCPAGEVCTARVNEAGDGLMTVCIRPMVDQTPFICQTDDQCPTGVCVVDPGIGFGGCLTVCADDADCGDGGGFLVCREATITVDGVQGQVSQCTLDMGPMPGP